MSHLTAAEIAAHLAGTDPAASEHVRDCEACTEAVAATELMAHATFGPGADLPDDTRRTTGMDAAVQQMSSPAVETVKALLRAQAVAREQDPRRALELSNRAVAVAQSMTGDPTIVQLLRAKVWRERAGTLRLCGDYRNGLAALDTAERELEGVAVRAYEDAHIAYARAIILWKMREQGARARELASFAAVTFLEHGDSLKAIHVRMLVAGMDFVEERYGAARLAFTELLTEAVPLGDETTIAQLHLNVAACAQEEDDLSVAAMHYASAVALFGHLEMKVEELRAEWNRGLLSLRMGHVVDGRARLKRASDGFLSHGNASDAALVTLDLVEHFVEVGERTRALDELQRIARGGVPPYVGVQLQIVTAALRGGDLQPAVRDVRMALMALPP